MRKLLLASAAMLGAVSTGAQAQQATQGQIAAPYFSGPVTQNVYNSGQALAGYDGAKFAAPTAPTPGTMVIRLNGRVQNWVQVTASTNNSVATGVSGGNFKTNSTSFGSYIRLYPGVDAMATNGLRYGAVVEIRQQLTGQVSTAGVASGLGGGSPSAGAAPTTAGATAGQTLFVNKAFAYFAHDNFGLVRMGQATGLAHLFDPNGWAAGTGWDGGFGALNGAGPLGFAANGAFAIPYALTDQGNEYSNPKIVYLSPQFMGFDVGFQYAPGMNQNAGCVAANNVCATTTTGSDPTRWYNQVAIGARYQATIGPVQAALSGFWEHASKEQLNVATVASGGAGRVAGTRFDDLDFFYVQGSLAYTSPVGLFTIGATWTTGDTNGGPLALKPTGGVKENQIVGGITYKNGPLNLGVQVNKTMSQGAVQLTGISQRNEFALAAGGNYVIAPGVSVYAEYVYAQRHQGGFNFVTGASAAGTATRDGKGQALVLGTAIGW